MSSFDIYKKLTGIFDASPIVVSIASSHDVITRLVLMPFRLTKGTEDEITLKQRNKYKLDKQTTDGQAGTQTGRQADTRKNVGDDLDNMLYYWK